MLAHYTRPSNRVVVQSEDLESTRARYQERSNPQSRDFPDGTLFEFLPFKDVKVNQIKVGESGSTLTISLLVDTSGTGKAFEIRDVPIGTLHAARFFIVNNNGGLFTGGVKPNSQTCPTKMWQSKKTGDDRMFKIFHTSDTALGQDEGTLIALIKEERGEWAHICHRCQGAQFTLKRGKTTWENTFVAELDVRQRYARAYDFVGNKVPEIPTGNKAIKSVDVEAFWDQLTIE